MVVSDRLDPAAGRAGVERRRAMMAQAIQLRAGVSMREAIERLLGHRVPLLLDPDADGVVVAISRAGTPSSVRVAWVDVRDGRILARVACPPGRPSRFRPLVATVVALDSPRLPADRVVVGHLAPEASALRPVLLDDPRVAAVPVGGEALAAARLSHDALLLAADALDRGGEPIGRLARSGISEMRFDGVSVGGHLRASHGMGAGIGGGRWVRDLEEAAFEAGYRPVLPGWMAPGLQPRRPRVEPDLSYPAAPPAVIARWEAADGARVLLRQTPAPLASPDPGGALARPARVHDTPAVLRGGRSIMTLVWEGETRAFGLQVRGMVDPEAVALRVAHSIPAPPAP
jgi:hypothetical protein